MDYLKIDRDISTNPDKGYVNFLRSTGDIGGPHQGPQNTVKCRMWRKVIGAEDQTGCERSEPSGGNCGGSLITEREDQDQNDKRVQ